MSVERKWIMKQKGDPTDVQRLANELSIDTVLANLLVQRGVRTFDEARAFFRPKLENLHDPFLMKDMDVAVNGINKAIKDQENIMIYGDYDVDGTTAVSLVYLFLKKYYKRVSFYIPDRYSEGYGISYKSIDYAKEKEVSLIIALDCGIKANDKIMYAKSLGLDFIICDHHLPGDEIPEAMAVLDPKRSDCNYPFKELSGCGVGFKMLQAFCLVNNIPCFEIYPYLDLLAVSIASDIVPVIGENRILTFFGLKQLNENPRRGLKSIIKIAGLENQRVTIDDIVFKIGPRINAAGRMESGKAAVDLLTSESDEAANFFGETINTHNNDRKNVDRIITQEAISMVEMSKEEISGRATILYNPQWHKGVIGIVASRLIESYHKPTIVLTNSNGYITGSARSIPGFDLYQAIEACSDLLENFGGHIYAAGLTMKESNLERFKERFKQIADETVTNDMMRPQTDIDDYLDFKQITPKFFRILKQFQPFGPKNMSPVFVTKNVYDNGNGRIVGQDGDHLRLELIQENEPYRYISGIAFNQSEHFEHLNGGNPVDICYSIAENYYRGIANIQLQVKDIKDREVIPQ
ncbi:MAG: single-stranded-DNA-specific exonuclease RecJ [Prevotellaceae bacterium]|jgi:single-stranded-DNA-specific exonuclease|nr:single-stranded-DNA-specific exonuclease RecJ [Prevotellaceae bacterium]